MGGLGAVEGEPVYYFWNPLYNLVGLIPWLLLAAAFILFRENRRGQALWMLAPVLLIYMLLMAAAKMSGMPSDAIEMSVSLFQTLAIGFTVTWLLGERIGGRNRFVTWLAALAVFACMVGISLLGQSAGIERFYLAAFQSLSSATLLLGLPLACLLCGKRFGPIRFSIWAGVWIIVLAPLLMLTFAAIQIGHLSELFEYFFHVLAASLIFAGVLIAGLAPFEILLFVNSFWRKRFEKVFGIKNRPKKLAEEQTESTVSVSQ